jgi:hypothetical protein
VSTVFKRDNENIFVCVEVEVRQLEIFKVHFSKETLL